MSSLWKAQVEKVDGHELTLRLTSAHPDSGAPSDRAIFALRLLVDGRERAAGDASVRGRDDVPGAAEEIIESVTVGDLHNSPFAEHAEKQRIEDGLRARGLDSRDAAAWQAAFADAWRELWSDDSRLPNARLTIRVHDPSWTRGLKAGDVWESAAYG
ncbi:hypothetical protein AB0G97_16170 [Streptomyces sp. NPDC020755]|uniref:hypothetical protein n=1 Tax=unclassified Streptomyces TaxID=2593676 RepID=UPI002241DD2F|nr:hypothetical protein [Streptomyces sp. VB1]UZI27781.1 hypothetical protein OH133_06370 [Streptomyces sp. VB1]